MSTKVDLKDFLVFPETHRLNALSVLLEKYLMDNLGVIKEEEKQKFQEIVDLIDELEMKLEELVFE